MNSKCIKDLNTRTKTKKLLEDNIQEKFQKIGIGNDFLLIILKHNQQREKEINQTSSKLYIKGHYQESEMTTL
jgi:hypothetical protein